VPVAGPGSLPSDRGKMRRDPRRTAARICKARKSPRQQMLCSVAREGHEVQGWAQCMIGRFMHACMYVCTYVYMYVCVYVYGCVYGDVYGCEYGGVLVSRLPCSHW